MGERKEKEQEEGKRQGDLQQVTADFWGWGGSLGAKLWLVSREWLSAAVGLQVSDHLPRL